MSEPLVIRSEADGIIELVLNRTDKLNAINEAMLGILREALDDLRRQPELRVMLIRARGRYFSAGADLAAFGREDFGGSSMNARAWFRADMPMQPIWQEMELVEKPVVVPHHGPCLGGGLEMSLSCDFRLPRIPPARGPLCAEP